MGWSLNKSLFIQIVTYIEGPLLVPNPFIVYRENKPQENKPNLVTGQPPPEIDNFLTFS